MSARLAPASFFDLTSFGHAELFAGRLHAWDVLPRIGAFLARWRESSIAGKVSPGAWLEGVVVIGEGSVVEPGAFIQGPCVIGRNTEVRHAAYIRGNVIVGDGCVVGHTTEVKNSIFLDRAKAGHFAYIGDSVLGNDVNLGAGTKLANLRLDGKPIPVHLDGERIDTGLRKFGAILGDGTETGCNSVLNPGTILGRGCRVLPCEATGGWWAAGSWIGAKRA